MSSDRLRRVGYASTQDSDTISSTDAHADADGNIDINGTTRREQTNHNHVSSTLSTATTIATPTTVARSSFLRTMRRLTFVGFAGLALFQALSAFAQSVHTVEAPGDGSEAQSGVEYDAETIPDYTVSFGLQQILSSNESRWRYPTDFTRGIVPKKIHSHNDYWRNVPYYSALSVGAISVEADIWLKNGTLLVGHEAGALSKERTLQSLYINPILNTLKKQNPSTTFTEGTTHNGVFDTASDQTLYLWLDCKTAGEETFRAAIKALEPLRQAGFLTTYSPSTGVRLGAVTVTGTGNTPLYPFFTDPQQTRDYFFDASLPDLGAGGSQSNITSNITQIASADFVRAIGTLGKDGPGWFALAFPKTMHRLQKIISKAVIYTSITLRFLSARESLFTTTQISKLRDQITTARQKGIGARYWDTPGWPSRVRDEVWRTMYEEGAALINVDDLEAAAFAVW